MGKIIEYEIVTGTIEQFKNQMGVKIKDGWQPFGSLSVFQPHTIANLPTINASVFVWSQAIVKYDQ